MSVTITSLCREVHNWFERSRHSGTFSVSEGVIDLGSLAQSGEIQEGQYFRILGSVFNDGVHQYGDMQDVLDDETFEGIVAPMVIPKDFLALLDDINVWAEKYGAADSMAMSPFSSESFGGYSYSKGSSGSASQGSGVGWQNVFAARLNRWRKLP